MGLWSSGYDVSLTKLSLEKRPWREIASIWRRSLVRSQPGPFSYFFGEKMDGVQITEIELVKNDERGKVFEFANIMTPRLILVDRIDGSVSGEHYHEGKIQTKNPEIVVLCKGTIELYTKNTKTGEKQRKILNAPCMVKIYPFIYHEAKALSDIILLEFNSLKEHEKDTIKKEDQI